MIRCLMTLTVAALIAGCGGRAMSPSTPSSAESPHANHAGHDKVAGAVTVVFATDTPALVAGEPATLRFHLEAGGRPIQEFEPTHEKLMHLIIVRDALDQFLHLHPEISADGTPSVELTLPQAGRYHVFVDYKPVGSAPATAQAQLETQDAAAARPQLTTNAPGIVETADLKAEIAIATTPDEAGRRVSFQLQDARTAAPVTDLQPYLGAMGHLVILRVDTLDYIHAHPQPTASGAAEVAFEVHATEPGQYAGWAQFQRAGTVQTVPFVFELQ